jgi:hypothetical protein
VQNDYGTEKKKKARALNGLEEPVKKVEKCQ